MHKDFVTQILSSVLNDLVITVSLDGQVKFWKKAFRLIDFVRQLKAHKGFIEGATLNKTENHLVTASSSDQTVKVFDILNFDMINMIMID